ncbi:hypothetical protein OAX78_02435, partial [Planctomycetota bacterium]|nr:hypothetical protein [Planctomycetota bacterium]
LGQRLVHHLAKNFASEDTKDRHKAADLFIQVSRKGSQDLRNRYFQVSVRRLGDALEIETDVEVFERLAECARHAILERISESDWDLAARLVRRMGRRRDARSGEKAQLAKTRRRILAEVLGDPRCERVFETIETGSQQERRKAARVLEGMGEVAVERLVRALQATDRGVVEAFLIDMLAALAPNSDIAIQKECTPYAPPAAIRRLLNASVVVCRDSAPVLITGLQNPDPTVQIHAVDVARQAGGKVAHAVLTWAVQNGSPAAQLNAVKNLGDLARDDAVDDLIQLLETSSMLEVRRECCLSFGKLALARGVQDKLVPVLINLVRPAGFLRQEQPADVRHAATYALGQMITHPEVRKTLERLANDKDERVAKTAQLMLRPKAAARA